MFILLLIFGIGLLCDLLYVALFVAAIAFIVYLFRHGLWLLAIIILILLL